MKTYIIAEIGINANADFIQGLQLVDSAIDSGANAIKFQYWGNEYIQKCQWRDKLEGQLFSKQEMIAFKEHIERKGVDFICTAFDMESFDFVKSLNPVAYKIPSNGYVVGNPILMSYIIETCRREDKKLYISTGAYDDNEIQRVYEHDTYGVDICLMHCVSEYPVNLENCNLNRVRYFNMLYRNDLCSIGLSDHSGLPEIPVAAVALGAQAIEVHVTLDKNMEGPDHKASLDINQFQSMVRMIH
ncbi:MAG: N-acetylneuraminate synthase family protein, partial [Nitrosarchaeum sp.]